MRHWIVAIAAAAGLLAAGPAFADREPELPKAVPTDLDVTYLTGGEGKFLYITVPKPGAPAEAEPIAWIFVGLTRADKEFGASYRQFDCEGRRMRSFGALTLNLAGRTIDKDPRTPEWGPIEDGTFGEDALNLVCGKATSPEPILHGLPALVADLTERRRQDAN